MDATTRSTQRANLSDMDLRPANNAGCGIETVPGTPIGGQFPTSSSGFLPGSLANCAANTRNVIEGTIGFWYRFYKGPKGTLQFGPQYSYIVRNTWSGAAGTLFRAATGDREHGLDLVPLLLAVDCAAFPAWHDRRAGILHSELSPRELRFRT